MEGTNPKEILSCACCLNDIGDEDYVSALGQEWHKDCFRCSECDTQLTTWYFEKCGMLFCQADYWRRYGDNCQQCGQVITGPVMAAGEHHFHPECFACASCGAHLEDTEPYALLDRSELYCGACYAEWSRRSRHDAHSIRVVRTPPRAVRLAPTACGDFIVAHERCLDKVRVALQALLRAALRACLHLTCHSIESSCNVLTLQLGDTVLEVNGAPVRGRAPADVERALARSDVLQLTIEHNPDTINAKRGTSDQNEHTDKTISPDSISPVERKLFKEYIPMKHSNEKEELRVRKERLFKRKGEDGGRVRVMKKKVPSSPLLGEKERSSSMSKLLDVVEGKEDDNENDGVLGDLSRARSFRTEPTTTTGQKVFRASDLIQGELLGTGFFGQVYKVTQRATGEVMVLKQLYRVDEAAQNNFLKEVAVLRSLRHRNVLRFAGVLYRDRRLHLLTEYVAGGTLHALLQDTSRPLSWRTRSRLARDVAAGVGYLHRRYVIHRDLNSHNCLIRPGEELTVVVADFGLARIVQRTASGSLPNSSLRRKRYTVVGNPYWMAPEMMNGKVYDEKVDVFSFGIVLCEIIGRVSADPDYLPRRSDFGLNERQFLEKFCSACPEPFYRLAFLACDLDPDARPSFEVMEIWLSSLVMHLCGPHAPHAPPATLLADILQYAGGAPPPRTPPAPPAPAAPRAAGQGCPCSGDCGVKPQTNSQESQNEIMKNMKHNDEQIAESGEQVPNGDVRRACALGKCVSASHLPRGPAGPPAGPPPRLCRSTAYILSTDCGSINITKVDDISEWLGPLPPLKRSSPDAHLNNLLDNKTRKIHEEVPSFLRNQSVEGLETSSKDNVDSFPFSRHYSIPDGQDSSSSEDEFTESPKNSFSNIKNIILPKKASYEVTDVTLRHKNERNVDSEDCKRFNIDYLKKSTVLSKGIDNIPSNVDVVKQEKPKFFTKTLLSPKLSRLFKPNTAEVIRKPDVSDEEKSRSKFFIQRPTSPITRSNHRVRPENKTNLNQDVLKSDLKLASMGKPMTPIFRRHLPSENPDFTARYSCRERRFEPKTDKYESRNRLKNPMGAVEKKLTQLNRSQNTVSVPLAPVIEKKIDNDVPKRREIGISRSNYVKLANLRISKELQATDKKNDKEISPVERVI